jgi:hypothetical protein
MKRGKNKNFHHALIFIPKRPLKVANGTHLPLPLRSASMTDYVRNESDPPSLKIPIAQLTLECNKHAKPSLAFNHYAGRYERLIDPLH